MEKEEVVRRARRLHDVRADREGHKNMVWDALPEQLREELIYREQQKMRTLDLNVAATYLTDQGFYKNNEKVFIRRTPNRVVTVFLQDRDATLICEPFFSRQGMLIHFSTLEELELAIIYLNLAPPP